MKISAHGLGHLNTWSPLVALFGKVMDRVEGGASLEEVYHLRQLWVFSVFPSFLFARCLVPVIEAESSPAVTSPNNPFILCYFSHDIQLQQQKSKTKMTRNHLHYVVRISSLPYHK